MLVLKGEEERIVDDKNIFKQYLTIQRCEYLVNRLWRGLGKLHREVSKAKGFDVHYIPQTFHGPLLASEYLWLPKYLQFFKTIQQSIKIKLKNT